MRVKYGNIIVLTKKFNGKDKDKGENFQGQDTISAQRYRVFFEMRTLYYNRTV